MRTTLAAAATCLLLAACTSDPDAPINQTFPIRQMDSFFRSMDAPPPTRYTAQAPAGYTQEPGYAPAYPPY